MARSRPSEAPRRLVSVAVLAGGLAVVSLLASVRIDEGDGSDDAGWMLGLLLVSLPLLAAAACRSVVTSTLLRPVGGFAAVVSAFGAVLHVAVAVDERGAAGLAYASPAILSCCLVVAVVVRSPVRSPASGDPEPPPPSAAAVAAGDHGPWPQGPPLDVVTPLRDARGHAAMSVVAWLVVVVAALASAPLFRVLGWPTVVGRVEAEVVEVEEVADDRTSVTFAGEHDGHEVRWKHVSARPTWQLGDRLVAFVADDGRVYLDRQFGLAGLPLFMPAVFSGIFAVFAVRRLWGLVVAWWDAHGGSDEPLLGYAAVIDDPAPRTWRPLVAVWERDPTSGPRLAKPDAVYRADDETAEELQCAASRVVVRRAWIDTGPWKRSKPRWVGVDSGVAVPHRRSVFGRWYVRAVTRRSEPAPVVELVHGPPRPVARRWRSTGARSRHAVGGMIAWRLLALVVGLALAFLVDDGGHAAEMAVGRP